MKINKSSIQDQIINGNLGKALKMLIKLTEKFDSDVNTNAIMLSSRFNSLKKDELKGTLTSADKTMNENRIIYALNETLKEIEDSWEMEDDVAENDGDGQVERNNENDGGTNIEKVEEKKVKTILFLAANPKETEPLRLDKEMREIDEGLRRAQKRDAFELVQRWAVQIPDLRRALLDESPSIVHFSGHGSPHGRIILEDAMGNGKEIPSEAIGSLFSLFSEHLECVILNACYSESQAYEISKHIPYVVGMNDAIPDKAAIEFSSAFYDAIGNGRDVEFAYKLARISIELFDIEGGDIPVLIKK